MDKEKKKKTFSDSDDDFNIIENNEDNDQDIMFVIQIPIDALATEFKKAFFANNLDLSQNILNFDQNLKDIIINQLSNTNIHNQNLSLIDVLFQTIISKQLFENKNYIFNENAFKAQINFLLNNGYRLKQQESYLAVNSSFNEITILQENIDKYPISNYLNNFIQRKFVNEIPKKQSKLDSETSIEMKLYLYNKSKEEVENYFNRLKNIFNEERFTFINKNELNLNQGIDRRL